MLHSAASFWSLGRMWQQSSRLNTVWCAVWPCSFLWLRSATRYILLTTPLCLDSWTWLVAVCSTHWRDERVRSKAWNLKKQGGMTSQLHLPVKLLQLLSQGDTFVELNCGRVACEWCVYSSYHAVFYSHLHTRAYCMLSYSINQALINTWSSDSCFLGKLLFNDTNNWQFRYKPTHTLFSVCEYVGGSTTLIHFVRSLQNCYSMHTFPDLFN